MKSKNIILLFSSILFSLFLSELGLQSIFYFKNSQSNYKIVKQTSERFCSDPYLDNSCYRDFDSMSLMQFNSLKGYVPIKNFNGYSYTTDKNGLRSNGNYINAKKYKALALFTGGSTLWGAGNSQENTITKLIEKKFKTNKNIIQNFYPLNGGVGGYTSSQEISRYIFDFSNLRHDYWIMFSGFNDVYAGYRGEEFFKSPDMFNLLGMINSSSRSTFATSIAQDRLIDEGSEPLENHFKFKLNYLISKIKYKLKMKKIEYLEKNHMNEELLIEAIISNIEKANIIAKSQNKKFVFILQPTIYNTKKKLTPFEKSILDINIKQFPNLAIYFRKIYPLLEIALENNSKKNNYLYINADKAIINSSETLFTDHCHFGDRGNNLIADFLVQSNNLPSIISKTIQ